MQWMKLIRICVVSVATACMMFSITACAPEVIIREVPVESPPAPGSSIRALFYDDFETNQDINRNLWKSNGRAHWVWQDGLLRQNSEDERSLNAIQYVYTPQMSNASVETKARINFDRSVYDTHERLEQLKKFIGVGIVFRMVDENNFYMFRIAGEEGCVLGKMVNGEWKDITNPRRLDFLEGGRIKANNWYKLKVEVYGSSIQCYINDSPIINTSDSQFTVGRFGLVTFKCFGDFEYIQVTN